MCSPNSLQEPHLLPPTPMGISNMSFSPFYVTFLLLTCWIQFVLPVGTLVNHSHKRFLSSPGGSSSQQLPHPLAPTSLEPLFLSALGVLGMALDRRLIQVWAFSRLTDRLWVCVNCWPLQGGALAEAEGSRDLGHFLILAGHARGSAYWGTVWRRLWETAAVLLTWLAENPDSDLGLWYRCVCTGFTCHLSWLKLLP